MLFRSVTVTGGQSFTNKVPLTITSKTQLVGESATGIPKGSVGQVGDYAVVTTTTLNKLYYKNSTGAWVKVGSADWVSSWPTVTGTKTTAHTSGQTISINGTTVTSNNTTISAFAAVIKNIRLLISLDLITVLPEPGLSILRSYKTYLIKIK